MHLIKASHFPGSSYNNEVKLILRVICFAVFAGRAWQHLVWDAPYRTLLWDETLLKSIVESLSSMTWNEYVTSEMVDQRIQWFIKGIGILYALLAIMALFLKSNMKKAGILLLVGAMSLIFLALLYCKEKFFHVGQFFEYTAQFIVPILLYQVLYTKISIKQFALIVKISIALTFICHGLYAINYYPRPGNFVDMVINILHVSEPMAHTFLGIAGVLDFLVAIAIFLPAISRTALIYAFIWGLLTSLARVWANFQLDFVWQTLNQWTFESVYRLPHAGLPFILIMMDGFVWKRLHKGHYILNADQRLS